MTRNAILSMLADAQHLHRQGKPAEAARVIDELSELLGQEEERARNAGGFEQ